ncbi:hypothetical protein ACFYQQ_22430 [Streptomyces sp. NPDC005496]|uniref:hypothetical protein n=1 Tax=unclassified Streptomyces TaxID=2593676 RepID=UPI0033B2E345
MTTSYPTVKLGRVARIISGVGFPHPFQGRESGEYPFLKVSDLATQRSGYSVIGAQNWVSRGDLSTLGARLAPTDSVVFPKVGAALLKNPRRLLRQPSAMDNNLMAVVPQVGDPRFWVYALSIIDLGELAGSGPLPFVNETQIRDLRVSFPNELEQRRIADFLDAETARIDSMVSTIRRLRSVLSERKEVHRSLALRGVHSHGPRTLHPMLGDLPDSWPVLPLKRLVPRIGVGVVVDPSSYFSERGLPFLRGSNITDGGINLQDVRCISEADSRKLWRSRLSSGDVVVIRAGYPGRAAVVPKDLEGANCASILILKKGDRLTPKYLEVYFNSPLGKSYVDSVRYGAAQEQINVSHVVDFMCPTPSPNEQHQIISEIEKNERPIAALQQKLSAQAGLLAVRRQALITAAVTGQFDVTTASGRNVTDGVTA